MRIRSNEIEELSEYLNDGVQSGNRYLCYLDKADYFEKEDLALFSDKYSAIEFCYEESTDRDVYSTTLLTPVMEVVNNFRDQLSILGENASGISFPFSIAEIEQQTRINHEFKNKDMDEFKTEDQNNKVIDTGIGATAKEDWTAIAQSLSNLPILLNERFGVEKGTAIYKNITTLEKQLLHTGMGEVSREELIKNILDGETSFELALHKKYDDNEVKATLYFNRSDKGNYFFNSYDLEVKNTVTGEELKQRFKVNYGNTFTLKEAFNLMQGRSVNKEFIRVDTDNKENNQRYNAWVTMDFSNMNEKGIYTIIKSYKLDLEKSLSEYPIKELQTPQYKADLIDSISRGNRQMVTLVKGDQEEKLYVEANPKHNALKFFDANGNKIGLSLKSKAAEQQNDLSKEQKVTDSDPASGKSQTFRQKENGDEQKASQKEMPKRVRKVG